MSVQDKRISALRMIAAAGVLLAAIATIFIGIDRIFDAVYPPSPDDGAREPVDVERSAVVADAENVIRFDMNEQRRRGAA